MSSLWNNVYAFICMSECDALNIAVTSSIYSCSACMSECDALNLAVTSSYIFLFGLYSV